MGLENERNGFQRQGFQVVKICPMCCGRQRNYVLARLISKECDFCGGKGTVDNEQICRCGRPAVQKINGLLACTRYDCRKLALGAKTA